MKQTKTKMMISDSCWGYKPKTFRW